MDADRLHSQCLVLQITLTGLLFDMAGLETHFQPGYAGTFRQLETLDLRDVFRSRSTNYSAACTASIIQGTGGRLRRLLIGPWPCWRRCGGAIAARGSSLEELSMVYCEGLSDVGMQSIAAACKQLTRLSVGGALLERDKKVLKHFLKIALRPIKSWTCLPSHDVCRVYSLARCSWPLRQAAGVHYRFSCRHIL